MENLLPVTSPTNVHNARNLHIIPVLDTSRPATVAETIVHFVCTDQLVELRGEGAGGIHQAVKAIALARQNLDCNGLDIACTPTFIGTDKTMVRFQIQPCYKR